ncbi:MAG: phosphoribosylanthranilate isomerase [Phycisphaerales bacterium]|nr:phosphoribosylanthranilate isomerase [Phycisphaerales bacterium]
MSRTRIKICGVKDIETAFAAVEAGADAIGFIFVRSSPRYIEPDAAAEIMASLPPFVSTVGVFMNMAVEGFSDIEEACPTTFTQLHGDENEELIAACAPVIKGIRFAPGSIASDLARFEADDNVESILIDGPSPGEGIPFQWSDLDPHLATVSKPIFLAGGLNPDNVADAIAELRPYAVDVSSGVERERGFKDHDLIRQFCEAVRRADAELDAEPGED